MVTTAWVLVAGWSLAIVFSFTRAVSTDDGWYVGFASSLYAPLALIPMAFIGLLALRTYGLGTRFGRAILIAGVGSVAWIAADTAYTFVDTVAYPGVLDIGFLAGQLLWLAAVMVLWRAVGIDLVDGASFLPSLALFSAMFTFSSMPTLAHVGPVPIGLDMLQLESSAPGAQALSITYVLVDVLLLHAAWVLWRRSFGSRPARPASSRGVPTSRRLRP